MTGEAVLGRLGGVEMATQQMSPVRSESEYLLVAPRSTSNNAPSDFAPECAAHADVKRNAQEARDASIRTEERITTLFKMIEKIDVAVQGLPGRIEESVDRHEDRYHKDEITGVHSLTALQHRMGMARYDTPTNTRRASKGPSINFSIPRWIIWLAAFTGVAMASGAGALFGLAR